MIQSLLILLIGIGIGVAAAGRLSRRRTGEREVRVQVHELESMVQGLAKARIALELALFELRDVGGASPLTMADIGDALSRVKLALGEGNGHAVKHDRKRGVWT